MGDVVKEFSALDFPTMDKLPFQSVYTIEASFQNGVGSPTHTLARELRKTLSWRRRRQFDKLTSWQMIELLSDYMALSTDYGRVLVERHNDGRSDQRRNT